MRLVTTVPRLKRGANEEWRVLHNEELRSLYRSPNIIRMIKYKTLRLTGHIGSMEEGSSAFNVNR